MPLIVAPLLEYDSLASLEAADAYWSRFPSEGAPWLAATVAEREGALVRGTQYILGRRLKGEAVSPVVLRGVREATCEAAIRALTGVLYPDVPIQNVIQETVGPLTTRYSDPGADNQPRFPIIEELLYGNLVTARGSIPIYVV